ncbi:MAG: DUF1801 domain-containing protein [candidate division WOR-3 bacterium]|nr:DUF1801 domain-containing protein [candidate division WOR-3 bacterium]
MEKEIEDFFNSFNKDVAVIGSELYKMVSPLFATKKQWLDIPDGMITFGTEKNMKGEICYIKPLKDSVNLGFFHGTAIEDKKGYLIETGKKLRHIKFKKLDDVKDEYIIELVKKAIEEHDNRNA